MNEHTMKVIARLHSDFPTKFGIPRQAGIVEELRGRVVFELEYRCEEALRGLDGFSHLWLIWQFSENLRDEWSPTVRPPRLGGNKRIGVFATRSPYRPNPLGLSCVKLLEIQRDSKLGPVLLVAGADLMDGTPIYDIKPYIPYADCQLQAAAGFAPDSGGRLKIILQSEEREKIPEDKRLALEGVLENDPRPRYQEDGRSYGLEFAGMDIKFFVEGDTLTVTQVVLPEK